MLEIKKEREIAIDNENQIIKKCVSLDLELNAEKEKISQWIGSGRKVLELLSGRNLKEGLGYKPETEKNTQNSDRPRFTPIKFVPSVKKDISNKNSVSLDSEKAKKKRNKRRNIGLLSEGQWNKRISEITGKPLKKSVKRNRNGKEGINKKNNYQYIPAASRKTCHNCGTTIHLAIDCRKRKKKAKAIHKSDIAG